MLPVRTCLDAQLLPPVGSDGLLPSQIRVRAGFPLAPEAHEVNLRHEVSVRGARARARAREAYQEVAAVRAVERGEEHTVGAQLFQPRSGDFTD